MPVDTGGRRYYPEDAETDPDMIALFKYQHDFKRLLDLGDFLRYRGYDFSQPQIGAILKGKSNSCIICHRLFFGRRTDSSTCSEQCFWDSRSDLFKRAPEVGYDPTIERLLSAPWRESEHYR